MLNESFNTSEIAKSIKGHVKVELFDAKSGKLIEKQEKHNFIANHGIEYFEYLQRINFKDQISVLGPAGADEDYGTINVYDRLVLTSSTKAEDSTNEWGMSGNLVGYSDKTVYSGADVLRGTPNASLCENEDDHSTWVFDWPTHAALGTIGSVAWIHNKTAGQYEAIHQPIFVTSTLTEYSSTAITPGYTARRPDGSVFVAAGTTINGYDSSYQSAGSFGSINALGICWDEANSRLWVISSTQIAAYDSSGSLVVGPLAVTNRTYKGLTFDGTNLWTIVGTSVYGISTAGADVFNFPVDMTSNTYQYANPVALHDIVYDASISRLYIVFRLEGSSYAQNNNFVSAKTYDTSGNIDGMWISLSPYYNNAKRTANNFVAGIGYFDLVEEQKLFYMGSLGTGYPTGNIACTLRIDGMGSRALLSSPIVKTDEQTLRITYRMDYPV